MSKIKEYVLKSKLAYHRKLSDYYYSKVDEYNADNNRYWGAKCGKHTNKCFETMEKLYNLDR